MKKLSIFKKDVGSQIKGNYKGIGTWYPGEISKVYTKVYKDMHRRVIGYDLKYDDGAPEQHEYALPWNVLSQGERENRNIHTKMPPSHAHLIFSLIEDNKLTKLGKGSFKSAYKLNADTVVTLEPIKKRSSSLAQYNKLMTAFYKLPAPHLKNILLPYQSYEYSPDGIFYTHRILKLSFCSDPKSRGPGPGHGGGFRSVDLFNLLNNSPHKMDLNQKKKLLKNCGNILETIFELHKKYITCMDIKLENTFVNCTDKNYLTLGDADGFRVYDNARDMYEKSECIVSTGFQIMGTKYRDHHKMGGPGTDYYAWLKVFLLVYISLFMKDEVTEWEDFAHFTQRDVGAFDLHAKVISANRNWWKSAGQKLLGQMSPQQFNNEVRNIMKKLKNKELLEQILKAIGACARDELAVKGEREFYNTYIEPIVVEAGRKDAAHFDRAEEKVKREPRGVVGKTFQSFKNMFSKKKKIVSKEELEKRWKDVLAALEARPRRAALVEAPLQRLAARARASVAERAAADARRAPPRTQSWAPGSTLRRSQLQRHASTGALKRLDLFDRALRQDATGETPKTKTPKTTKTTGGGKRRTKKNKIKVKGGKRTKKRRRRKRTKKRRRKKRKKTRRKRRR